MIKATISAFLFLRNALYFNVYDSYEKNIGTFVLIGMKNDLKVSEKIREMQLYLLYLV